MCFCGLEGLQLRTLMSPVGSTLDVINGTWLEPMIYVLWVCKAWPVKSSFSVTFDICWVDGCTDGRSGWVYLRILSPLSFWIHLAETFHWSEPQPSVIGTGMRISPSKSETMVYGQKRVVCSFFWPVVKVLPQLEVFNYLGILFMSQDPMEREIDRWFGAASAVKQTLN